MSFRRILGITLLLVLLGFLLLAAGLASGLDVLTGLAADTLIVAAIWVVYHLLRRFFHLLLFRVGNRLFLSYLLIGVVPIGLVLSLGAVLIYLLTGQLAVRRVEQELQGSLANLRGISAAMAAELDVATNAEQRRELFRHQHGQPAPGLGWAIRPLAGEPDGEGPLDPQALLPEGRIQTSLEAVGRLPSGEHFLAVVAPPSSAGSLIVYQRIEPELRQALEGATRVALSFPQALGGRRAESFRVSIDEGSLNFQFDPKENDQKFRAFVSEPVPVPDSGYFGKPWIYFPRSVELPYVEWGNSDWHLAIEGGESSFALVAHTSVAREYLELFNSAAADDINLVIGQGAIAIPLYLSIATAILYLLTAIAASVLVYRIARTTSRLHRGFAEVEKGNFQVRLKLRGRDQLAELVQSFNRMAAQIGHSLEEKAEREAIERELEIARQLQRSLLPPSCFRVPGIEIAVDFLPAAAIGGDFYHFSQLSEGRLLVAIADVSGHGLSTGIVMSAAKALLSALATDHCPCGELLRRLDDELRAHTGRRNFVTLGLCVFDLELGRVEYTNAGHPYPYRLQPNGTLTTLENPSRPLAVDLPQNFCTLESEIAPGDLWILYSDGMIEAQSPSGEVFGFERFESLLHTCAGKSADETRDTVLAAWQDFVTCDCPEDDRTLLVLEIKP